jgi:hypothetical protein
MTARKLLSCTAAVAVVAGLGLTASLAAKRAAQAPAPAVTSTPDAGAGELSPNVKVLFQVTPPEKAIVLWGKKSIGVINPKAPKGKPKALIVERPRDSGPMDVVIKAQGYIPVHSRAYTFSDTKLWVKLTKVEEKKTLFGYREELPDAGPEAGAAAAPAMGPRPDGGMP